MGVAIVRLFSSWETRNVLEQDRCQRGTCAHAASVQEPGTDEAAAGI